MDRAGTCILVVEDEPLINQAVGDRLRAEGHHVVAAYDGPGSGASGSTTGTAASELTPAGGTATPAPPADPIDAGNGTRCVN